MRRGFVPTALAALAIGSARSEAGPSNSLQLSGNDTRDIVRESLSLVSPEPAAIGGIVPTPPTPSDRPTIADPGAQTPAATFTYRPAVAVTGDTGLVGTTVGNSRRNPGSLSNLRGTIGSGSSGIFAVPRVGIAIDAMPAEAYNYLFRPILTVSSALPPISTTEAIPAEPFRDSPAHSVFIGVRSPIGDSASEQKAREALVISATGSASPTVIVAPVPGGRAPGLNPATQRDSGTTTTIGFSTKDLPPTKLPPDAVASTTLSYTYVPVGPKADPSPIATVQMRPPTIAETTVGASIPVIEAPRGVAVAAFAVARTGNTELLTIPLQPVSDLNDLGAGTRSLFSTESDNTDDSSNFLRDILLAAAVTLPLGFALLAFRLIRRTVLRRLDA